MNVVEVEGLRKVFCSGFIKKQRSEILKGIDFTLNQGSIAVLMGPNGSGKTTFLKILATLILPTAGHARVCNYDVVRQGQSIRAAIALVHNESLGFFERLTGLENLQLFAALHDLSKKESQARINYYSEALVLVQELSKPFHQCSTGMKRRLAIARALIARPKLLLLDEPTNSLDEVSAELLRAALLNEKDKSGMSIIYVTHLKEEARLLNERAWFMSNGKIHERALED